MIDKPLQDAIDACGQSIKPDADYSQQLVAAKIRGLMAGYHARWQNAGYETLATEILYRANLFNPETGRQSRSFELAGVVDVDALHSGARTIIDHKTTSEDISDPNAPYWRQLVIERQPTHYMLLMWLNGQKAERAIWDVVRKPSISPKKLTKAEITMVVISKKYAGRNISEKSIIDLQTEGRETLEMYEARLADDCTRERPEWYFQRKPIPRLDAEIHEHGLEVWEHSKEILHARQWKRWARNSGACMQYHSPCKFLGICSGYDTPESDNWKKSDFVHNELVGIEGDGRNILTNSRIAMFQTCRRKHFLHYELGIERLEEEEREALFFGTVWHQVQAAWWNCFKQGAIDGTTNDGSSVTGIAATAEQPTIS